MGTVGLIGSDDLLACFIAGNSFTWNDWFRVETEEAHLTEVGQPKHISLAYKLIV
jgi:hypothetical protein